MGSQTADPRRVPPNSTESSSVDPDTEQLAGLRSAIDGLRSVQGLQRAYDSVGWRLQEPTWAKTRHLLYHLVAIVNELAVLIEAVEHAADDDILVSSEDFRVTLAAHSTVPGHLVFHAAQLANIAGTHLGEELMRVWAENARRFAPTSEFARLDHDI